MAIITISRGTKSGGDALAVCLGDKLGYPTLSRELLVEAASKLGVSEEKLRWSITGKIQFRERWKNERRLYLIALRAALAEHCLSGNLVYHGNAGHFLLKDVPIVLRVRLIAPMESRIHMIMDQEKMKYDTAKEYILCADRSRVEWTRFLYGVTWSDPKLYDLVINLDRIDIDTACAMISSAVSLPHFTVTESALKSLANFALVSRVKLALAENPPARGIEFDVRANDGKLEIFGEVATAGVLIPYAGPSEADIASIAKTVEGVKEVKVSLRRFPEYSDA